jgi:putative membrane protein
MIALKQTAVALALGLAGVAFAQAPAQPQARAPFGSSPATPLTQEQLQALGVAWAQNQLEANLGDVAASRGSSPEVKAFAKQIGDGHKLYFGPWLTDRLKDHGTTPAALPPHPERQRLEQEAKDLAARKGDDFDRALVAFVKRNGEAFVDALKHARDVTPGSDPALKKLLDDAEDAEEVYLTRARQLDSQRVQGRTPPSQ